MSYLEGLTRVPTRQIPLTNPRGRANPDKPPEAAVTIKGRARFEVVGPDDNGEIVTKQSTPWYDNILTTYGLASIASAVGSSAAVTASNWIEAIYIGTSTTAAASTDSSLGASTASLTIGNASFTKTNTGAMTVEYQATFASNNTTGSYTIGEIGLYCNSTGNETQNHMAAHAILSTIVVKGASDVVNVSYDIIFTTS
jgi:hypothetical protein